MRGKRSKQYRKLMQQYCLTFGFREPYQVLVDADMLRDADKFKMDLVGGLEKTLHGQVKPMITQCSMRHLYAASKEAGVSYVIDKAKMLERRRCDHMPEDYPQPLSAKDCLTSVVDPKKSGNNKHRYVIASQDMEVRKYMRSIKGVPLIYINRSVMIMEPMAGSSLATREEGEGSKFRAGIRNPGGELKRKRVEAVDSNAIGDHSEGSEAPKKKKRRTGPKAPNPLSVMKPKKRPGDAGSVHKKNGNKDVLSKEVGLTSEPPKRKRKRPKKHLGEDPVDAGVGIITEAP